MELMHTESETTAVDSNNALTHDIYQRHDHSCYGADIKRSSQESVGGYLPMLNDATCFKQVYIVCGYTDYPRSIIIREVFE